MPESPRWLVSKKRFDEAEKILKQVYNQANVATQLTEIQQVVSNNNLNWRSLFKESKYIKVIFIGAAVGFFTQTVGINAFNYYAPKIFLQTGFATATNATFYTMFLGLMLVLSTISSLFFIDKIGRRNPLLLGTLGITIVLAIIVLAFTYLTEPLYLGWIFLICASIFMLFHGISIGPACFLIPAEIFPLRVRGLGMSISVACNWGANIIVATAVPVMIANFGVAYLFAAFLILTIMALIIFYFYIPETKGTTLEQIERNVLANVPVINLGMPILNSKASSSLSEDNV